MHNPTAKLASFLFKGRRLSQASLELSSSRGVFASRESERKKERKKRDKRENKSKTKIKTIYLQKAVNLQITKILQRPQFTTDPPHFITKHEGYL